VLFSLTIQLRAAEHQSEKTLPTMADENHTTLRVLGVKDAKRLVMSVFIVFSLYRTKIENISSFLAHLTNLQPLQLVDVSCCGLAFIGSNCQNVA
jgi:hypothetical protein